MTWTFYNLQTINDFSCVTTISFSLMNHFLPYSNHLPIYNQHLLQSVTEIEDFYNFCRVLNRNESLIVTWIWPARSNSQIPGTEISTSNRKNSASQGSLCWCVGAQKNLMFRKSNLKLIELIFCLVCDGIPRIIVQLFTQYNLVTLWGIGSWIAVQKHFEDEIVWKIFNALAWKNCSVNFALFIWASVNICLDIGN